MSRLPLVAGVASLAVAFAMSAAAHDHAVQRGRLIFADHEKPVVRVLDLDTGEVTHSFDLPRPNPGFSGVEGGRYVVIKTGDDAGTVRFLDTGLIIESHGDHADIDKAEPKLLDLVLMGDKPAHVVSRHGRLAVFYDGQRPWERKSEPKAALLDLKSLRAKAPELTIWPSPAPQHGIAVPVGGKQWLLSMPNPTYARGEDRSASSRPDGFEIFEQGKSWKRVASFNDTARADASCKLFHGFAAAKGKYVFGCAEGVDGGALVLAKVKGQWRGRKVAYPDERRISSLKARDAGRYMVGNYGLKSPYNALLRFDPTAASLATSDVLPVPGGQAACQFELNGNGARVANLTADGKLRIYEIAPVWKELAAFDAVPAFDCAYGAKTPTPNLAVVGGSAFVSDPTNGRIREFHLDTLKQGLDMPVGGAPANLAGSDAG